MHRTQKPELALRIAVAPRVAAIGDAARAAAGVHGLNASKHYRLREIACAGFRAWHSGCARRPRLAVVQQLLAACRT